MQYDAQYASQQEIYQIMTDAMNQLKSCFSVVFGNQSSVSAVKTILCPTDRHAQELEVLNSKAI